MKEAIRILEGAKGRNIEWMKRLPEGAKQPYIEKNKVIDKAVKKLTIPVVVKSLKDKETISFEDWKKRHIIDNDISGNYLHESEGWVKGNDLIKMYKREQNL